MPVRFKGQKPCHRDGLYNFYTFSILCFCLFVCRLADMNKQPYTQRLVYAPDNETLLTVELLDGPERKTMYVTALYYTMTCMTRYE